MNFVRELYFPVSQKACLNTYVYLKKIKTIILRVESEKKLMQYEEEIAFLKKELESVFEQEGNFQSPNVIKMSQLLDEKIAKYYLQLKKIKRKIKT